MHLVQQAQKCEEKMDVNKRDRMMEMDRPPAYADQCIHCRHLIAAGTAKEWHKVVKAPRPRCGHPW